jgi:phosphatidate cytidylyltransferase
MSELEIGVRALWTVGGIFGFGILVILLLGLVRRKKVSAATDAGAVKKVPLWARYATLVGLAVAVLVPAYFGELPFAAIVGLLVLLGMHEFWGMLAAAEVKAHRVTGYLGGLGLVAAALVWGPAGIGIAVTAALLVVLTVALFGGELESLPARAGGTALGVLYVGLLASFFVLIRHGHIGFGRVLFFLMVIQLADVFGLVGGLAFGRRPLAPTISPGKTWEGTLGSAAAAIGGAALFAFAVPALPLLVALAFGLVLFIAGLVGDLLASGFKRSVGLKDFGAFLPGHGGILDRFDGYLLAAPVAWLALCAIAPYLAR